MERLQKVMAHAGVASRRKSEEIIEQGRVKVNGEVITELGKKVSVRDEITVDEIPLAREQKIYVLLNKPRETISTVDDPKNRDTVVGLIQGVEQRIYPVGRLDWDTTGALLLTNDGELSYKLTHPSYEFPKTYVAKVNGHMQKKEANLLAKGIKLEGKVTAPAKVNILSYDRTSRTTMVRISMHEGRNHQVKKMFNEIGYPVNKLTRESFGFLTTNGLQSGEWRFLKPFEIKELENMVSED